MKNTYVLTSCDLGKDTDNLKSLQEIKPIKEAHSTFSAYDIIAKVISNNAENLKNISWKIRKLSFIRATLTLIGIEVQS